jgi:hypothetical protein
MTDHSSLISLSALFRMGQRATFFAVANEEYLDAELENHVLPGLILTAANAGIEHFVMDVSSAGLMRFEAFVREARAEGLEIEPELMREAIQTKPDWASERMTDLFEEDRPLLEKLIRGAVFAGLKVQLIDGGVVPSDPEPHLIADAWGFFEKNPGATSSEWCEDVRPRARPISSLYPDFEQDVDTACSEELKRYRTTTYEDLRLWGAAVETVHAQAGRGLKLEDRHLTAPGAAWSFPKIELDADETGLMADPLVDPIMLAMTRLRSAPFLAGDAAFAKNLLARVNGGAFIAFVSAGRVRRECSMKENLGRLDVSDIVSREFEEAAVTVALTSPQPYALYQKDPDFTMRSDGTMARTESAHKPSRASTPPWNQQAFPTYHA